ncbi:uncharacterized protein KZ484_022757 [Pholidichthys leucotaenia]
MTSPEEDHNSRSGADRRSWKWFEQMDAIYGHRHASIGRAMARDTATTSEPFKESAHSSTAPARTDSPASDGGESVAPTPVAGRSQGPAEGPSQAPSRAPSPSPSSAPSVSVRSRPTSVGKRRKRNTLSDIASIMEESHEHDRHLMERMDETLDRYTDRQEIMQQKRLDQLERHHQQFSEQMREAHREELTETQIFNRTFLTHFGNLVKAMSDRRE